MGLLQRCATLLRGASLAAEQGGAFSPSGMRYLSSTMQSLRSARGFRLDHYGHADAVAPALLAERGGLRLGFGATLLGGTQQQHVPQLTALFPTSLVRGLFSARKAVANPQIHTHDKYKTEYPQPTHDFLLGRFVVDRNGTVWHRQANYRHQRHDKTASQLTRLKRWKPLYSAFASKLKKVGFKERYWAPPDATDVPGFEPRFKAPLKRRSAVPALNQTTGDPALRQSYKPGPRQRLR